MKMSSKTKQKMAKQRLRKIKTYYKSYNSGDSLYSRKLEKLVVLVKRELHDEYYFVVQNKSGELLLQKLVYNGSVSIVGVSKNGVKYAENKWIFDLWFREAQDKLNRWIRSYYNWTSTGKVISKKYTLVLKKEFADKYYFVLRTEPGKLLVAKLIWYTDVQVIILSTKEFDDNKSVFYAWINEARRTIFNKKTKKL